MLTSQSGNLNFLQLFPLQICSQQRTNVFVQAVRKNIQAKFDPVHAPAHSLGHEALPLPVLRKEISPGASAINVFLSQFVKKLYCLWGLKKMQFWQKIIPHEITPSVANYLKRICLWIYCFHGRIRGTIMTNLT